MNKKKFIPLIAAAAVIAGVTLYFEVYRNLEKNRNMIEGSGTIEVTEIEIAPKIAGRIKEIPPAEGDTVKQNDLLVRLEYEELSAQRLSAEAGLTNVKRNLERARELYKTGSISKKDLDNAETAYSMAKANYDFITATIREAVIYAPIRGTVLERNLETGELAFPGSPILTLADLTKPWIKIYVQEKKIGLVKIGQSALISVDSFPDKDFKGRVVSISNKAEFTPKTIQTREERVKLVFAVKIALENQDNELKPGMPADAIIDLNNKK